jgi:probable rRNA maturation factor
MRSRRSARATRSTVNKPNKRKTLLLHVHVQDVSKFEPVPDLARLRDWIMRAVGGEARGELSIRIIGEAESATLNERYRRLRGATNVLSFAGTAGPAAPSPEAEVLGDVVICAPVVDREAREQGKTPEAHWAHIALHGVLHLLGYDHETEAEAQTMERREAQLLAALGFDDPYRGEDR